MTTPRKVKATKQEPTDTSEAKAFEELAPMLDVVTLEEYIKKAGPKAGLVASFKYEAEQSEKGLKDRSEVQWKADFDAQATRVYKSFQ